MAQQYEQLKEEILQFESLRGTWSFTFVPTGDMESKTVEVSMVGEEAAFNSLNLMTNNCMMEKVAEGLMPDIHKWFWFR